MTVPYLSYPGLESCGVTTTAMESEDDAHVSDHTRSMRRACVYCIAASEGTSESDPNLDNLLLHQRLPPAASAARGDGEVDLQRRRQEALLQFWGNDKASSIKKIDDNNLTRREFVSDFLRPNQPCIIRGVSKSPAFASISRMWNKDGKINRAWFRDILGPSTLVPLRKTRNEDRGETGGQLDEDGRAEECETIRVRVEEWTDMLEHEETLPCAKDLRISSFYLKDWHLWLEMQKKAPSDLPLYTVPDLFPHDLLNDFLTTFTDGDYRFCYWGPTGSFTPRHSDVLHSYSWGFNVLGTKRWTFYSPFDDEQRATLTQKAGDIVFVPSMWQHDVTNLEETISINHNWITTTNLDCTWKCLTVEMFSIERELDAWGSFDPDDWLSRENMLRGCIGLDVTSFFLMMLKRLVDLQKRKSEAEVQIDETDYDIHLLSSALREVMECQDTHAKERIAAVVDCMEMADELWNKAAAANAIWGPRLVGLET